MRKYKQAAKDFLFLLKPYWKHGKLLVILEILGAVIAAPVGELAGVTVAQAVIDAVMAGETIAAVLKIVCVYFAVYALAYLAQNGVNSFYTSWKRDDIKAKIDRDIFAQAQRTDFRWIDDPEYFNTFDLALKEYANRSNSIITVGSQMLTMLVTSAAMIGVIAQIGIIIAVITAVGMIISMMLMSKMTSDYMKTVPRQVSINRKMDYTKRVYQQNSAAADMKSTNVADALIKKHAEASKELIGVMRAAHTRMGLFSLGNNWSAKITSYCVILYIGWGLLTGRIESVGAYATLIAASSALSNSLSSLGMLWSSLFTTTQSAGIVRAFFDLESVIEPSTGCEAPGGALSVELRGARFGYPNSDFAVRDIDIKIAPGEKIAIVGENGAGKSTLMKLLLRLYDTDGGGILYNGKNIKDYDVHALRRRVGSAFQTPNVYALTLAENLQTYNRADAERLSAVLREIGLPRLADKLDEEVTKEFDENGIMLSGGEAQKLALARLLTGDFGLLLLDEPSSALDPIAEHEMTKLLFSQSSRTTTIMVAHRLSTVRDADRIYLIDNGSVAEQGTHDELIAKNGKYAEMFRKQAENYVK
jgi:ATP-binding cassette subfamily B protein